MAKRPKGMSSREMAAQKAGGKLNYKTGALVKPQLKVATKPKAVSPLVGAGPLMTGQSRVSSEGPAIGPLLQNQSRPTQQKSTSSNRSQAAKAFSSKSLSPTRANTQSTDMSGSISQAPTTSGIKRGIQGSSGGILAGLKGLAGPFGQLLPQDMGVTELLGINRAQAKENPQVLGAEDTSPLGQALAQSSMPDIPTGYGDNGAIFFNGNDRMGSSKADFIDPNTGRMRSDSNPRATSRDSFFSIPTAQASENGGSNGGGSWGDNNDNGGNQKYDNGMYSIPGNPDNWNPEIPKSDPATTPLVDKPGSTVGKQYGSGKFGTGKGVMSDDPYIKELRKAYSSNGGEKWLRKQFEELIAQLDPTYAALQTEGTNELNQQLVNQNNQLASVMNANNIGDSEFRQQAMARQQTESQTALGNLLAKLSQAKAQDASGYRSKLYEGLQQNQQTNKTNQQKLMEAIQGYKDKQWDRDYKMKELGQKGGGSTTLGSQTYLADDANGNPTFWNSKTGQNTMTGFTRKSEDPVVAYLKSLKGQGGEQGDPNDPSTWSDEQVARGYF